MNALDQSKYGYPLREGYTVNTDLALLQTETQSGWRRQRRTFLHNASLITLTWRLPMDVAKEMREWLQAQPDGDFFSCRLLTGNDINAPCDIADIIIRRTTGIREARIPRTSLVTLTFSAETQSQAEYNQLASAAANQPPATYPANFPLPAATGFVGDHADRNVTSYSLTYGMSTELLADWLAFAGFQGTAWFYHPMISSNVLCGYELVRYVSPPSQTLIGPNAWSVSVDAETQPAYTVLSVEVPPVGECSYDSDVDYDDPVEEYDCGGVVPPQGGFTMPAGTAVLSNTSTGTSPQTATVILKLNRDGSVESSPQSVPAWQTWHTAPETLPGPAVACSQVCEISIDSGTTWQFITPTGSGTFVSLQNRDVWLRLTLTGTYDQSATLDFTLAFEASQLPTPIQFAFASVQFNVAIDVTDPTGVVQNPTFSDGYVYTIGPGDTVESVSAGVTFNPNGQVIGQTTFTQIGDWYSPNQIDAGANLWIILTGTGSGSGNTNGKSFPPTGTRLSLAVVNDFTATASSIGGGSFAQVQWDGTYQIYNAQSGGVLLGSGTINLSSEVSQ